MAENSKIEWTDHTFNPWVGCTKVSPACDHCYAESWAKRAGNPELWQGERRQTTAANWRKPVKWNDEAAAADVRRRVFCASLADVFDNQVPDSWRTDLWNLISVTPHLDWQLLTKRPQNIRKMLPADWGDGYPNVWLGTTVENQEEADRRIHHLLNVPARIRFLSCEPLLGQIDFNALADGCENLNALTGLRENPFGAIVSRRMGTKIDWVIAGGESGPGARLLDPIWPEILMHDCRAAGTAFFMKQMSGVRRPLPPVPAHLMVREFPKVSRPGSINPRKES
jgi:protein gp37